MYKKNREFIDMIDEKIVDLFNEQLFVLKNEKKLRREVLKRLSVSHAETLKIILGECSDE